MTEPLHVLLAQSGDREAFDTLLKSIQEPLFRYILRITGERAAAEDTLQDVFLLIFRKLRWLNDPALFRPWAYRIATRAALARMKRDRRTESIDAIEIAEIPDVDRMVVTAQLPDLLSRVSPASRTVLALHYLEDMTLPEVADILGISIGTVKSRLAYGLTSLREAFNV
jgi:RNA polymerase sigma-70 factor (ECF subfamily)